MPIVNITMLEGRTEEQKRNMVKAVTEAIVETSGARPENVTITIVDVPPTNVATGGVLNSDKRRNPA
ncbi:2-hydroxymuconate tautomerase family protein [Heliobacillus mobilis]|uniref:Tautomerase n=2 Tax=Heliobacterium TaxID=2697 RepID=A0A6I3SFK6_HELMO|nr:MULTISPECIES: 2-hydroxymuconate tautomerase [Heliobacterium]MBC9783368.1 2-hydroxymuconate tautomerase family protein [Heliobacterium chlorum]MTV47676.1 2-hydroxymuconate tautomerase family protein [Heliobacterium mobile]